MLTIRMARAMPVGERESGHAFEFEQAPFLTLGICYEQRPRFSGGAYQSVLRRADDFLDKPLDHGGLALSRPLASAVIAALMVTPNPPSRAA